jgi:hypothetical protein
MQLERWLKFSKSQQMGAIGAEIMRAKIWEKKDRDNFVSSLERALELIDLSIHDRQWRKYLPVILGFREEVAKFYVGINKINIEKLYDAI